MLNSKQNRNGNRFLENMRSNESSLMFSQNDPKNYFPGFSASNAQMDRIIHQRMQAQFPDSHFSNKSSNDDYMGLCENMGKMNFEETQYKGLGLNPNNEFNQSHCFKNALSFKDFRGNFSGDHIKSDDDLYAHVVGLREGFHGKNSLGSDFSPQNPNPLYYEESYNENRMCNLKRGSYNGGPQFDTFSINRPCLDHQLTWSQNSGMNSVFNSSRGSSTDINPVSMMYPNCASSKERLSHDVSMLYPNLGPSVEIPMSNDLKFYPNPARFVENTLRNDPMYANRSPSVMPNDMMFYPNRASCFENPMCNSSVLYANPDFSVENKFCNEMVFGDGLRAIPDSRGLNINIGDLDTFIIEGKKMQCIDRKGKFTRGKGSKGRKPKPQSESVSQNRIRENSMNQDTECLMSSNQMISKALCGSLYEFRGYVYCIAKDQEGCRFLQRVFEEGLYQDVQIIFNETIHHVGELMMDPFANYLIQKLLEVCSEEQRTKIVIMVTAREGELVEISLNTHGTRVVQKLIETLKTRQQKMLVVSALQARLLELVMNANGWHVIKNCLHYLSKEDNKFIFDAAVKCCFHLATHQQGCMILKSCIAQSVGRYQEKLVTEITSQGFLLAQDAFGNYVVQHIIELKIPLAAEILSSQFRGKYVHLSMQKFSSHVVQTFLNSYGKCRSIIIKEFVSVPYFGRLLQDPYANYVIQTAIDVTEGPLHDLLVQAVQNQSTLRNSPFCKKLFYGKLLKK